VIAAIRDAIGWGIAIADVAFDQLYAPPIRAMSIVHWTPVQAALRAAAWLAPEPAMRVLDIGSGAGKLCCIGALATGASWVGIERERGLVDAATGLATTLELGHRARFRWGDMSTVEWKDFDSLYFYNPFEAVLFGAIPTELPHRWTLFGNELDRVTAALSDQPSGMRVVTYHGFGGEMPPGYSLMAAEQIGSGQLALWVKRTPRRPTWRSGRFMPRVGT
jgi:hypothetical protein